MNAHINTIRFSRLITIIKMRRKENLIHQQIKTKKKKRCFHPPNTPSKQSTCVVKSRFSAVAISIPRLVPRNECFI